MFCQNLCIFSGRLGQDAQLKEFDWGNVIKIGIAVDMPKRDPNTQEWGSETSWVDCEYIDNKEGTGKGKAILKLLKGDVVHVHCRYKKTKDGYVNFRIVDIFPEQKPRDNKGYDSGPGIDDRNYQPKQQREAV